MQNLLQGNRYGFWRGAAGSASRQTRRLCGEGKLLLLAWMCVGAVIFFCLEERLRGVGLGRCRCKCPMPRCWCGCWTRALHGRSQRGRLTFGACCCGEVGEASSGCVMSRWLWLPPSAIVAPGTLGNATADESLLVLEPLKSRKVRYGSPEPRPVL